MKDPEVTLWAAAFNHLDGYEFRDHFESITWTRPDVVQVLVAPQDLVTLGLIRTSGRPPRADDDRRRVDGGVHRRRTIDQR
jgi:hypothetical protein